jgi:ankyrin repeat protein
VVRLLEEVKSDEKFYHMAEGQFIQNPLCDISTGPTDFCLGMLIGLVTSASILPFVHIGIVWQVLLTTGIIIISTITLPIMKAISCYYMRKPWFQKCEEQPLFPYRLMDRGGLTLSPNKVIAMFHKAIREQDVQKVRSMVRGRIVYKAQCEIDNVQPRSFNLFTKWTLKIVFDSSDKRVLHYLISIPEFYEQCKRVISSGGWEPWIDECRSYCHTHRYIPPVRKALPSLSALTLASAVQSDSQVYALPNIVLKYVRQQMDGIEADDHSAPYNILFDAHTAIKASALEAAGIIIEDRAYEKGLQYELLESLARHDDSPLRQDIIDAGYLEGARLSNGQTVIHIAAAHGRLNVLERYLNAENMNQQDERGRTPLHWALKNNRRNEARYLLEQGARMDIQNEQENYALTLYMLNTHRDNLDYKLCRSLISGLNSEARSTVVGLAAKSGNSRILRKLLKVEDVRLTFSRYFTQNRQRIGYFPLSIAIKNEHQDCVDILYAHAKAQASQAGTWTVEFFLHVVAPALINGDEAVVEQLYDRCPDLESMDLSNIVKGVIESGKWQLLNHLVTRFNVSIEGDNLNDLLEKWTEINEETRALLLPIISYQQSPSVALAEVE